MVVVGAWGGGLGELLLLLWEEELLLLQLLEEGPWEEGMDGGLLLLLSQPHAQHLPSTAAKHHGFQLLPMHLGMQATLTTLHTPFKACMPLLPTPPCFPCTQSRSETGSCPCTRGPPSLSMTILSSLKRLAR